MQITQKKTSIHRSPFFRLCFDGEGIQLSVFFFGEHKNMWIFFINDLMKRTRAITNFHNIWLQLRTKRIIFTFAWNRLRFPFSFGPCERDRKKHTIYIYWMPCGVVFSLSDVEMAAQTIEVYSGRREKLERIELKPTETIYPNN